MNMIGKRKDGHITLQGTNRQSFSSSNKMLQAMDFPASIHIFWILGLEGSPLLRYDLKH